MIIVLIGYMGSGKSTVGKILADKLSYKFIDLDDFIEVKEGKTIAKIFESSGEIYFRKAETKYLSQILNDDDNIVLSLGGGTPCYGNNMSIINDCEKVVSVYLKTSITAILSRIRNEKDKRPLVSHLKDEDELTEFIGKHLFERAPFYSEAKHTLTTDNLPVNDIVEAVVVKLF